MQDNVNSVVRAMQILELLDGSSRGFNISEISRRLETPKSTTHLIVLTLERLGYVTKTSRNLYELSLKAYALGRERMQAMGLPTLALPSMTMLAGTTRLTTHLSVLERSQGVIVQKINGSSSGFDTFTGKRNNLHCTATGKVLLAYATPAAQKQMLLKTVFMRHTRNTITSAPQLRKTLQTTRDTGFGFDDEEEELGARCVAVPVFGPAQECVAALSLAGTTEEIDHERIPDLLPVLRRAAAGIQLALRAEPRAAS